MTRRVGGRTKGPTVLVSVAPTEGSRYHLPKPAGSAYRRRHREVRRREGERDKGGEEGALSEGPPSPTH